MLRRVSPHFDDRLLSRKLDAGGFFHQQLEVRFRQITEGLIGLEISLGTTVQKVMVRHATSRLRHSHRHLETIETTLRTLPRAAMHHEERPRHRRSPLRAPSTPTA